jgi:DNA repair protein SbcC/Rad50
MIPKYLKIEGLYSYKAPQEIHFDQLTEAALFGIFGSVGSGKSSILEAITFALYGDTERLNKSGDNRYYNMMNLSPEVDTLNIDFECLAGKDSDHLRFTVRGKKNKKDEMKPDAFERKAYMKLRGEWSPITAEDVAEKVLKLTYENFRRTIIIPQGRFQEFIELKDTDRTKMMKELFNLGKYDLDNKIKKVKSENNSRLDNLRGQLTSLGDATPDMVVTHEFDLKVTRQQIKDFSEELKEQMVFDKTLTDLRQANEKIQNLTKLLTDLYTQRGAFILKENTLKNYEICARQFKSLLDLKKSNQVSFERNNEAFEKNKKRLETIAILVLEDQKKLEIIRPQYEQKESLLAEAKDLEIVIEILDKQLLLSKKTGSVERGLEKQKAKEEALVLLKNQKQHIENNNDKLKSELPDIQEFSSIKSWFNEFDSLQLVKKRTKEEAENLQKEIVEKNELLIEKIKEINQNFSFQIGFDCTTELLENAFSELQKNTDKEQNKLREKLQILNTQVALQQYATDLKDGEECPLCGAVHHPALAEGGHDFTTEIQTIKNKIAEFQKIPAHIRTAQMSVEKVFSEIANLEKNKIAIRQKWGEIKVKIDNHEQNFTWIKFNKADKEGFEKMFNSIATFQKQISDNELVIKKLGLQLDQETQAKIKDIDTPLMDLQHEISGLKISSETLTKQLSKVQLFDYENQSKEEVLLIIKKLKHQYETIKIDFEITQQKILGFDQEKSMILGSQQTLFEELTEVQKKLTKIQQDVDNLLVTNVFESENSVLEILNQHLDIDIERKLIEDFKGRLRNTEEQLQALRKDYGNHAYDVEQHKEVTAKITEIGNKLNFQRTEEGRIDSLLKKAQQDLARKINLLKEQENLEIREKHLGELTKLFRTDGFVNFVSSVHLKEVCNNANVRFHKMTRQQLHLELGDNNSFLVRDMLNGGKLRLLKTLSGGQKFQAALSLALALADNIHRETASEHNFFFLDEGFGSLDRESLKVVFETLKSLRKENRIVGIISHVEDLQQEIDRYLMVKNCEEFGSVITVN